MWSPFNNMGSVAMQAFAGWMIIAVFFALVSAALLWPAFWLIRRLRPGLRGLRWTYTAATVGFAVVLWYAIPFGVHAIFGRAGH
jgi:hypothetical protein